MSQHDSNVPINPDDLTIINDIKVPSNIDANISFPIEVINTTDDRLMGIATFYRGDITSFQRAAQSTKNRPKLDLGILRPDLDNILRITLDGLYSPTVTGSVEIVSGNVATPLPDGTFVQWTVELSDESGVFYSRSIVNGSAIDQELASLSWYGTIHVTAKALKLYGELTQEKIDGRTLGELITVRTLGGLMLPEWASGF